MPQRSRDIADNGSGFGPDVSQNRVRVLTVCRELWTVLIVLIKLLNELLLGRGLQILEFITMQWSKIGLEANSME